MNNAGLLRLLTVIMVLYLHIKNVRMLECYNHILKWPFLQHPELLL